jgi:hypothetical protein
MSFWYSALPAAGVAGVRGVASRWLLAGVLGALGEKHGKKACWSSEFRGRAWRLPLGLDALYRMDSSGK